MKNTIKLTESELNRIINESIKRIIKESDNITDRIGDLKKMSRTYKPSDTINNALDKTWNGGMGRQSFIEVLPEEGVILYNSMLTYNRDLERIKQVFPDYKLIKVDKSYYSHSSLKACYKGYGS